MNRALRLQRAGLPFAEADVERNLAFDGFDNLQKGETFRRHVEAKSATRTAMGTNQAVMNEALQDLGKEVVPYASGFGQFAEGRLAVRRKTSEVDRDANCVICCPSDLHFANLTQ